MTRHDRNLGGASEINVDGLTIDFGIGVDEAANTSIEAKGDLDPNSQMAWNWQMGYKFVLLEGSLRTGGDTVPIVYHVGFSENRKPVSFNLPEVKQLSEGASIAFDVNVLALLNGKTTVDMSKLPSVKFDPDDAKRLANNYQNMITLASAN